MDIAIIDPPTDRSTGVIELSMERGSLASLLSGKVPESVTDTIRDFPTYRVILISSPQTYQETQEAFNRVKGGSKE